MKLEEKIQMLSAEHEKIEKEIKDLYSLFDTRQAYERNLVAETLQKEEKRKKQEITDKELALTPEDKEIISKKLEWYEILIEDNEEKKEAFKKQLPKELEEKLYDTDPLIERKMIHILTKNLDKEKLLLAAEYLSNAGIIYGSCGGQLGGFKRPTSCELCYRAETTIHNLGLEDKLVFLGDRQYIIPEKTFQSTYEKIISSDPKIKKILEVIHHKEEKKAMLEQELERLGKKAKVYEVVRSKGYDPEKVDAVMPEAIFYIQSLMERSSDSIDNIELDDIKLDLASKTLAIMTRYWYYSGSGGCEYGKIIEVIRGDAKEKEKFVYRDAYDPDKDDWSLDFDEISDLVVEDDTVSISLSSRERTLKRTYILPYRKEEKATLSEEEQQAFLKHYQQTKERLLQLHTNEQAIMPDYVPYYSISATGNNVPYRQPEIIEEMIDERHGVGYVVIKAQIDHHIGRGMQFEWVKYRIEKDGSYRMEGRDCAYEQELLHGKQPKIRI